MRVLILKIAVAFVLGMGVPGSQAEAKCTASVNVHNKAGKKLHVKSVIVYDRSGKHIQYTIKSKGATAIFNGKSHKFRRKVIARRQTCAKVKRIVVVVYACVGGSEKKVKSSPKKQGGAVLNWPAMTLSACK